jgi:hypothetical protein
MPSPLVFSGGAASRRPVFNDGPGSSFRALRTGNIRALHRLAESEADGDPAAPFGRSITIDRLRSELRKRPLHGDRRSPIGSRLGAVAQLGERVVRNDEVSGSIPLGSTSFPGSIRPAMDFPCRGPRSAV